MVVAQKFVIALAQSGDVSFVLLSWGHQQEGGKLCGDWGETCVLEEDAILVVANDCGEELNVEAVKPWSLEKGSS